jgi:arabinose-5-phosphate isomerase
VCAFDAPFRDVVSVITRGKLGVALVMKLDQMLGIITDGDLRKVFESIPDPLQLTAADFMTVNPIVIDKNETLANADLVMKENAKRLLVVMDRKKPVGILQIFDIEN